MNNDWPTTLKFTEADRDWRNDPAFWDAVKRDSCEMCGSRMVIVYGFAIILGGAAATAAWLAGFALWG